jgi:hypothetical protein
MGAQWQAVTDEPRMAKRIDELLESFSTPCSQSVTNRVGLIPPAAARDTRENLSEGSEGMDAILVTSSSCPVRLNSWAHWALGYEQRENEA